MLRLLDKLFCIQIRIEQIEFHSLVECVLLNLYENNYFQLNQKNEFFKTDLKQIFQSFYYLLFDCL